MMERGTQTPGPERGSGGPRSLNSESQTGGMGEPQGKDGTEGGPRNPEGAEQEESSGCKEAAAEEGGT